MSNNIEPKKLIPGDHVRIISTARIIEKEAVETAEKLLISWGLNVSFGKNLFEKDHQFAGAKAQRVSDLQDALNDESVNMIWLARGGYGTVSLIDSIDFSKFLLNPKWVVGYSDITGLLCHIETLGVATVHGPMPISLMNENVAEVEMSISYLHDWLFGRGLNYMLPKHPFNRPGYCDAEVVGGNLSVLFSILGSRSVPDFAGKILFLEDLDEYLYHIDRMMLNLSRNGVLDNLAGLIVGGMTDMNDNTIPFGKSAEETIYDYVKDKSYPAYFGFSAGHIPLNLPIPFGVRCVIDHDKLSFFHQDLG